MAKRKRWPTSSATPSLTVTFGAPSRSPDHAKLCLDQDMNEGEELGSEDTTDEGLGEILV